MCGCAAKSVSDTDDQVSCGLPLKDGGLLFRCPESTRVSQHVAVRIENHPPDVASRISDKGLRDLAIRVYLALEPVDAPVCVDLLDHSAVVIILVGEKS